jgi:hypothetical protein
MNHTTAVALGLIAIIGLGGCHSRPLTPIEAALEQKPLPVDQADQDDECRSLAELYSTSYVALATWHYAKTQYKATPNDLESAMRAAKTRAIALHCPAFWEAD